MPRITALLHTYNDALRLGRCLETLYACDELVIIDHGSEDDTLQIARAYAAKVIAPTSAKAAPLPFVAGWVLCLDPRESLTEGLTASLFEWKSEWKSESLSAAAAFSVFLREETAEGWIDHPQPQTRLVPASWDLCQRRLPANEPSSRSLEGRLLRFAFP